MGATTTCLGTWGCPHSPTFIHCTPHHSTPLYTTQHHSTAFPALPPPDICLHPPSSMCTLHSTRPPHSFLPTRQRDRRKQWRGRTGRCWQRRPVRVRGAARIPAPSPTLHASNRQLLPILHLQPYPPTCRRPTPLTLHRSPTTPYHQRPRGRRRRRGPWRWERLRSIQVRDPARTAVQPLHTLHNTPIPAVCAPRPAGLSAATALAHCHPPPLHCCCTPVHPQRSSFTSARPTLWPPSFTLPTLPCTLQQQQRRR